MFAHILIVYLKVDPVSNLRNTVLNGGRYSMTPVGNAGHYVISCEHWVIRHSNLITRLWPSLHNRWHQGNGSVIYWPHWQYELCRPIITHKTRKKGQFFFLKSQCRKFYPLFPAAHSNRWDIFRMSCMHSMFKVYPKIYLNGVEVMWQ